MSRTEHLPELESLRSQVAELSRKLAERDQSMQDLREQSDLLRAIVEGTNADTGDEFFASLATHLTASLHMQYAVIGKIVDGTPVTIRTVAVASGGALLDNFEYDLTQAPCGIALTESFWCYEQGVQALFPNFPPLATLGVDSHSGVSIRNKQGDAVGLIVVMDTKPITNQERLQALLHVFAPHVAAELQRKHAETALQEQTQRLAHAQALAHLGSWNWEIGSGEVQWSDEQARIFGHEPGALPVTYDTFLASLHPDDHDRVLVAINGALVGQMPFDMEYRIVRPNGEVRVIHARGDVHRDAAGHPLIMAGTVLDITERKQVEDALRASEERWHLAVRGSNDGIWDWNIQAGKVFYSSRWKAMRGFADYEIADSLVEWRSRIHPDDLDRVLQHMDAYLAKQRPDYCEEYRVHRKDGSSMWILDRGVAIWNEAGTATRMAGSQSDISERKRAEEALRQSKESYAAVIDAIEGIVWEADPKTFQFSFISKQAQRLLGYPSERWLAEPTFWKDHVHPDDLNWAVEFCMGATREKRPHEFEHRMIAADGRVVWLRDLVSIVVDQDAEVVKLQGIMVDITNRKQAEDALRRSEQDLRTVLDALPVGVWFTDATGKVRLTNPAGRRIWAGVQQVGLEGTAGHPGWWEHVSSSGEPHRWALARALTKGEATLNEELTIQCLDGTSKAIINSAVPLFGENGQVSGAIIVNQDIMERKALERDRAQTQAFLQSILENIPHIITVKDAKTLKIVQMNRAAEQVLGLDRHALADKTLYDCLPETEANALWAADLDALQRRTLVEMPKHVVEREGERDRIFRTKKAPILDAEGEPLYLVTISEDITEWATAEAAVRQRSEHIIRFQQARLRLMKGDHVGRAAAWKTITETGGSALGVERVSIWLFNEDRSAIVCRDLYGLSTQSHEQGAVLEAKHYPNYFEALASDVALTTSDARTDPRTDEFREHYLPLFGITSMMDAPIHLHGRVVGVLCHEHTGPPREWTSEEQSFAASVADQVALSLEAEERALAETALRSTKNQLQAILDHSPAVIFVKDTEGRYLLINRRYEALHHVSPNEVMGKTDYDIFDRDTADGLRSNDRKVLQAGCPLSLEETVPVDNGILTVISTTFPLKDANGRPYAVCGIATDITERKHAEETLRQNHVLLSAIMETSTDFIYVKDLEGRYLLTNPSLARFMGKPVEDIIGQQDHVLLRPELAASCTASDQQVISSGTALTEEEQGIVGGKTVVYLTTKTPYRDREGRIIGVIGISRDISERKRAEDALRQSHAFIRQIIDTDPNFIFTKDREGRFTLVNQAVADAYGSRVEDLVGKTDADFNRKADEGTFFHGIDLDVMNTREERFTPEEIVTDAHGNRRWVQTVKRPILDETGRAVMVLGAATDITDRKRMEEILRQRERDLRAAIEERERISQDLHDGILQSLFAVGLTLETSKSMMSQRKRKTADAPLNQAIDQLNRVMHEIRNFIAGLGSDLLQGKDLPTALQHMLESLTQNHATRVRLAVEDRAAQAVSAEQSLHLLHVIQEAVSNCIRHGRAQEATVSLKMLKQGVRLSIRDNGKGFNPNAAKGTGHGLINMAARAQKIGGRFAVLSTVNEGTRVILDLPKNASYVRR